MAKLYGKGTITELIRGRKYRLALSAGKDPISGKYRRYQETFLGSKRQAELRIEEIRRELENGKRLDADKITFADWCGQYLSMREDSGKYRPKTLKQDRSIGKHLISGLGAAMVVDITPSMINDLYSTMRKNGIGDTTVKQAHKMLKRVLDYALRNDIIIRNPVDRVDTPRKPKPKRQALTAYEANRLSAICASGTPTANKTAVYLGLATGARLGEIAGLTWAHVALDNARPYVHIVQQFTAQGELAPLKTDKDDNPVGRIIPLDASTVSVLRGWRSAQREQLNTIGIEQGNDTPVISNQIGAFTNHSRFQRWWRDFCIDNGFGKWTADDGREIVTLTIGDDASLYPNCIIIWRDSDGWPCDENGKRYSRTYKSPVIKKHYKGLHFHELRHTHFTMRLAAGMDIPTAQALGGWTTPDVLLNVYAHPVAQNIWDSAGFMDRLTAKQTA